MPADAKVDRHWGHGMKAAGELGELWNRLMPLGSADSSSEAERLAALRAYHILDTGPEDAYDRVVELARVLFNSPIAAVAFMDETRLWFKARSGFQATEEPREIVFCDHVIRQDGVMVVPDLQLDARFVGNPLVWESPKLRFYAGAPLITPGGQRLGTVCIMSPEPRTDFGEAESRRLAALAGIVSHELELRLQAARAERLAAERGLLLQAVEHRLRGGLQLVTCVLEAQAMRCGDGEVRRTLYEAADRVAMIEAVHQQIFQNSNVFETDAREYLLALVGNLQDAVADEGNQRTMVLNLDDHLEIAADRLPAVGLVVTELLTNALRHGRGQVDLSIAGDDGIVVISVADEGPGFAQDVSSGELIRRLGLRLVAMLALPGGIAVDPERRQRITVRMRR